MDKLIRKYDLESGLKAAKFFEKWVKREFNATNVKIITHNIYI